MTYRHLPPGAPRKAGGESPIALLGYPPEIASALRDSGIVALGLPGAPLDEVLAACETLGFLGALIHADVQESLAPHLYLDPDARRAGRADAVAFTGGPRGTYTAPEALLDALQQRGYTGRSASAMLIGRAHDLQVGLGLARLGFRSVTVVASNRPLAEQVLRGFPAGVAAYALSRDDRAVQSLAERCELIVLTGGRMPLGVLQPFHTVIDLTGHAGPLIEQSGSTELRLPDFPLRVLSRQLEHVTGQRIRPELLETVARLLTAGQRI